MSQSSIDIPPTVSEQDARLFLAFKLFELGRFSAGQAAEFACYSKRTFVELLGKYGIPLVNYPPSELSDECRNA